MEPASLEGGVACLVLGSVVGTMRAGLGPRVRILRPSFGWRVRLRPIEVRVPRSMTGCGRGCRGRGTAMCPSLMSSWPRCTGGRAERAARAVVMGRAGRRAEDRTHRWRRWPSIGVECGAALDHRLRLPPSSSVDSVGVLIFVGWKLFVVASHHPDLLRPAIRGRSAPVFQFVPLYGGPTLPVVNFKQRDGLSPAGWAAWAVFGFTFAGWLLAAIVVAGLAGVFRRD